MDVESPWCCKRLVPIVFSHGLSSNRTMHSVVCRDLASQGFIVFAPDHMDLSSSYYETPDREGYWYSNKHDSHDLAYRSTQLTQRVTEIRALLDDLYD
jgi:predicted dienelactone hydrolase